MGIRYFGALAAVSAILMTGCGSKAADPVPTPIHSATPSVSSSPTRPVAPVMPDAAKAHTTAGAEAFIRYYWEAVAYGERTGDISAIDDASLDGCKGCNAGIKGIRSIYDRGGVITGAGETVSRMRGSIGGSKGVLIADYRVGITSPPSSITYSSPPSTKQVKGGTAEFHVHLFAQPSGWQMSLLEAP